MSLTFIVNCDVIRQTTVYFPAWWLMPNYDLVVLKCDHEGMNSCLDMRRLNLKATQCVGWKIAYTLFHRVAPAILGSF